MATNSFQEPLAVQPVSEPILCSPYTEPDRHWIYDSGTGMASLAVGRRPASYWFRYESRASKQQMGLFAEEEREELPLVNALRSDVKRWRESGYEGATEITKQLLRHWWRADRQRRLFFCQLEAVESVIFLQEIRLSKRYLRFNPQFTDEHLGVLWDSSPDPSLPKLLRRLGVKMATGSGKTVVMSMLIAWAFCNRGQVPSDERFPWAVLAVCPNLTIRERLQVLRPDNPGNYYEQFDLVPVKLRPLLHTGKVLVENWHSFLPESVHAEGGQSYAVVNKGPESPEAFARKRLGDLFERAPVMVLNDEAHHAWRPAPILNGVSGEVDQEEWKEATVWVNGLDMLNHGAGIAFCVDLSATPFYIQGSGFVEGSPFPWVVSDFSLVDAIECGIVKIPRLPVSDTSGRPEARYFKLWEAINSNLRPGEKLPRGGKPKPEVVYREAQDALTTLASQWVERFHYIQNASNLADKTPPVMIVVCDNTDIAKLFFEKISGEREEEYVDEEGKSKSRTVHGAGEVFPDYFSNTSTFTPTIRIDSKLLAEAESADPGVSRQDAAEQLRRVVATVGKAGEPGAQVRCVVSVAMLTEGWDANNVTHILGLRAFGSQLLCEQVVGRGLRRMNYTPDPETGMLTEEYVDIYGVPFSLIPFRGRVKGKAETVDKPVNQIRALPERAHYEIQFPVVEGYAFALRRNAITADIAGMERLRIQPEAMPTSVFVKPRVGYQMGSFTLDGPGGFEEQDRQRFYESTHLQTIKFQIAGDVVFKLVGDPSTGGKGNADPRVRYVSRHQLFPQVFQLVEAYVESKVDFRSVDKRELGLQRYYEQVVGRLMDAIRPDAGQGESPLLPILNRYQPKGTTADVNFTTVRPVYAASHTHINAVVADTATWEQSAAFRLEQAALRGLIQCYARNDGLGFTIPYEFLGQSRAYEPDYLVRINDELTLVLEIKGWEDDEDRAKHQAALKWRDALNNWGKMGRWLFHVCKDPQMLLGEIEGVQS